MIEEILARMGYQEPPLSVNRFFGEEDNEPYNVWKIQFPDQEMVLKEAKGYELEIYSTFFHLPCPYSPKIFCTVSVDGKEYLLMEYIRGESMTKGTRASLRAALDSLIEMQKAHWSSTETAGFSYDKALPGRQNRGNYLNDPLLEVAYALFLEGFESVPRTLCHDDLLPFNVICNNGLAVFIDWEFGGILPYPVSLARLIAHGEESADSLFYMKEEDKSFALDYFFTNFIQEKGIPRAEYDRTMALFLFYEYCEWVYLGNKYEDADKVRYQSYLKKASTLARSILDDGAGKGSHTFL